MQPAIAQRIQKQRPRQPVLEAARGVRGFVLEIQVDAVGHEGGQPQRDEVRVGAALVVGFDAGDGFVVPGGAEGHWGCGACGFDGLWPLMIFSKEEAVTQQLHFANVESGLLDRLLGP